MNGLRSVLDSSFFTRVAEMNTDNAEWQFQLLCFPWCIIHLKGVEKAAAIEEKQ